MNDARRALGLIAVAAWLLLDSLRAAGPLILDLAEPSVAPGMAALAATLVGGAVLAWVASLSAHVFSHGHVVWFVLSLTAVARLGLPFLEGGWLIGAGLYVLALALASVILTARVAVGAGGGPALLAGTALGGAAAIAEQAALRTLDAVWRADAWGWIALIGVAVLAVFNGWRCHDVEPAAHTRGWWGYGFYWALLTYAFANLGFVASQADVRLSVATVLAMVGLLLGARLAASAGHMPGGVSIGLAALGAAAVAVATLVPGTAAMIALPAAAGLSSFAAALVVRSADGSPLRSLGASFGFVAALALPVLAAEVDRMGDLPIRHAILMATAGIALMVAASLASWQSKPRPTVPGVLPRVAIGALVAAGLGWWTHSTYEQESNYSANFLANPSVLSWNVHHGVTPTGAVGPGVNAQQVAQTITDYAPDVTMLQEVNRGSLAAGGLDMVEYLAGELDLPYLYGGAQTPQAGNAIITSRPFSQPRVAALDGDGGPDRGAVSVSFMGATYVSTQLTAAEATAGGTAQAEQLAAWLDDSELAVVGGDLGDSTGSAGATTVGTLLDEDFTLASAGSAGSALSNGILRVDFILGRGVEMTDFAMLDMPWSDHLPLTARVSTGLDETIAPEAAAEQEDTESEGTE